MEYKKKAWSWIVLNDKRILLIKRPMNKKKYPWLRDIPWGRWEENETYKETAIREVKEEVGLDFIPTELFWESIMWGGQRNCQRFLGSRSWTINLQLEEADGYARYTYDEAIKLELAFDFKDLIEKLKQEELIN